MLDKVIDKLAAHLDGSSRLLLNLLMMPVAIFAAPALSQSTSVRPKPAFVQIPYHRLIVGDDYIAALGTLDQL